MNAPCTFIPAAWSEISEARNEYLNELRFPQDAHLEALVRDGNVSVIQLKGEEIGYAICAGETLVEFFLRHPVVHLAHSVYPQFLRTALIQRALVKTFDDQACACALDLAAHVHVHGMLCREFMELPLPDLDRVRMTHRLATAGDLKAILSVEQDVFTHPGRLAKVIENEQLVLFEREGSLIGFGIARPVVDGRRDVEIGLAVDVPFRNRGYAAYILRDMALWVQRRGQNPISGCSIDNVASIRLGQRVGFRARHRILRIEFDKTSLGRKL